MRACVCVGVCARAVLLDWSPHCTVPVNHPLSPPPIIYIYLLDCSRRWILTAQESGISEAWGKAVETAISEIQIIDSDGEAAEPSDVASPTLADQVFDISR